MSKIAILGCGPNGLIAAWAFQQEGHHVNIFAPGEKSVIPGSLHLHGQIDGITNKYPEGTIQMVRMGTAEDYARKVYGNADQATGWDNYYQVYPSWNAVRAYDILWEHFSSEIQLIDPLETPLDRSLMLVKDIVNLHDETISTIPAQVMCRHPGQHQFTGVRYWIKTLPTPPADERRDTIVYNGLRQDHWYRWSILGGICSIETTSWGYADDTWKEGTKANSTNCNCWPLITRMGRWAKWEHGVLMYHTYLEAKEMAEALWT